MGRALDFILLDQEGQEHTLSQYRGRMVLLYFYPKDQTPGCTVEAEGFRDTFAELALLDVVVLGVSRDTVASHKEFCEMHALPFTLLADTTGSVCEAYGVVEDGVFKRESFLISREGEIIKHYENVKPSEHPAQVLDDVKKLS
jgi:peroxiredoxin Q/BCP